MSFIEGVSHAKAPPFTYNDVLPGKIHEGGGSGRAAATAAIVGLLVVALSLLVVTSPAWTRALCCIMYRF